MKPPEEVGPGLAASGLAVRRRHRVFALLLLLAAVASPLLADPWAAALLAASMLGWATLAPPRRQAAIVGLGLLAALVCLVLSTLPPGFLAPRPAPSESGVTSPAPEGAALWTSSDAASMAASYESLWRRLEAQAERGARELAPLAAEVFDLPPEVRLAAFRTLGGLVDAGASGRGALFLLDPDGRPRAWAGEGLLHELDPETIPRAGTDFQASFGAVTLEVILPLEETARPWRVMAARSLATDHLPFPANGRRQPRRLRWSLLEPGMAPAAGSATVRVDGLPVLAVREVEIEEPAAPAAHPLHRLAWLAIAFSLLAAAVLRVVGLALPVASAAGWERPAAGGRWSAIAAPALAAGVALGLAAAVPPVSLGAVVGGLAAAGLGLSRAATFSDSDGDLLSEQSLPFVPRGPRALRGLVTGVGTMALLALLAWALQQLPGLLDLSGGFFADPRLLSLRLALFTTAVGLLAFAVPEDPAPAAAGDRWGWVAVGLLASGGALHDTPLAGIPLLLAGGASAGLWLSGRRRLSRAGALATLACLAAMAAAGVWETVYRLELRQGLARELLPRMAPPAVEEQEALGEDLEIFFAATDLEAVVPRPPAGLEIQDLAFTLWKRSPLARSDTLSALVVETADGSRSTFSFGLPLDDNGLLDPREGRWEEIHLPVWKDRIVEGTAHLGAGGRPWATARWWLYLQPGFRLRGGRRLEDIEAGLLAGLPRADRTVAGLPAPAMYALYGPEGRVLRSPWEDAPQMEAGLTRGEAVKVGTPSGWSWAFPRRGTDGWEVLYLPVLGPLAALEQVATHAVGSLLVVGALTLAAMLLALPRPAFRELLRRTVRSYSKRLILVHTALVLLPLVSVNVLLVAAAEERFQREQRAAGEAALSSLQRLLGSFLRDLDPGVSLQTELDNDYMTLLSRVVHHEVNLYWQSAVFVSSRSELFTAGLLPKRIPGEIYSRLALLGHELGSRTNRVGETPYLELYAPFKVGGTPVGEIFFSVPLLAQQAEVARELAALRRQVLLVTVAIFGLLIAVGLRLARSFSEPLMELVAGTRRIASGAASLDLAPTELELAALVEAIDDMAHRLAEGRLELLREKEVVERMVDNITSGVVSLDRERRVLMRNRVAADLLGVEVGERLDQPAQDTPRPAAVTAFLAEAGSELRQKTVRLTGEDGGEREWSLVWVPVPGSGEPAALLVVEDATEVLRGQRLEAWAEMARIIAHEIKNPLTPIRLNAEHLRQVWSTDSEHFNRVFERCTENILHQVDELQQIASEFSTYSSILHIDRRPDDLVEAMRELAEPYRIGSAGGVAVGFEAPDGELPARFDRRLLGRAVRNLIENALRASRGSGEAQVEPAVILRVEASGGTARVAVLDRGPGVDPELLHRIFDPYFSTHDTGTGLGLPIARRVAEEHGGTIAARNRPGGGLEVVITLPLG